MLTSLIVSIVAYSRSRAFLIVFLSLILSLALGCYIATHFRMNTDVNQLLAADLPWRVAEKQLENAFPQKTDRLVAVIDGKTPDLAENAAEVLATELSKLPQLFRSVERPEKIEFFKKNGALLLGQAELGGLIEKIVQAQPMLGSIAADPSLRGAFNMVGLMAEGVAAGMVPPENLQPLMGVIEQASLDALNGEYKPVPWRGMMIGGEPSLRDTRKFIITQPVLDYSALSPGEEASKALRNMARELKLTPENGVLVRLTGSVALNDEEFSSVSEGAGSATFLSFILVISILFLALRSFRLIIPILITLSIGLVLTTAFAMAVIGSLNLISVAFAVMFVGIAVDFGIQFGVRYRDQKHMIANDTAAMRETAAIIARPLALAAVSTAVGFLAFIPTDYRGVAELGIIAGAGMIIAFALNITLLPAMLTIFKTPAEPEAVGFAFLAPANAMILRYRGLIIGMALFLALVSGFFAAFIRFDFDPLNLKDPKTESVSTLYDIMQDPSASPYVIEILAKNKAAADELAEKISQLPEVDHTLSLSDFLPQDQDKKLAMLSDARFLLDQTLNPSEIAPPPSEEEIRQTLLKVAAKLEAISDKMPQAQQMAQTFKAMAESHNADLFELLHKNIISGMVGQLQELREFLAAEKITPEKISEDLLKNWQTPDGQVLVQVYPKGDARDYKILTSFTKAVRNVAPEAGGAPISIEESGKTVYKAFIEAGIYALIAIALLVWGVLRRIGDVLKLLAPLVLAALLTLATMVVIGLPLNFANIIALPLLLSLGVSYAIYFVTFWRDGREDFLQSSMARAVLFSALTALAAFGALALSSHPGTGGMGKLLTVSLIYSLICTWVVLPALLGRAKIG